jgi:hypothetical protein
MCWWHYEYRIQGIQLSRRVGHDLNYIISQVFAKRLSQCVGHDLNYIISQVFAKRLSQCVGYDLNYIISQVFAKRLIQCVGHDLNYIISQVFAKRLSQCVGYDLSYTISQVFAKSLSRNANGLSQNHPDAILQLACILRLSKAQEIAVKTENMICSDCRSTYFQFRHNAFDMKVSFTTQH